MADSMTQNADGVAFETWVCDACNYIYDEAVGDADSGLAPGTRMQDIPDDWYCPVCGVSKRDFRKLDIRSIASSTQALSTPGRVQNRLTENTGDQGVVVIGGGHAGWAAIRALRESGYTSRITLISACAAIPYNKPALSVTQSRGGLPAQWTPELTQAQAGQFQVELLCDTWVLDIRPDAQRVLTTRGSLRYSHLILALGAQARMPSFTGNGNARLHVVNDLLQYQQLTAALSEVRQRVESEGRPVRMTLIGGGLVGCELANDFANAGIEVTLLDVQDLPLQSRIGLQQASGLRDALQDIGVRWMGSAQVEQITAVQTLAKSCFTGNPVASPTAVRLQIRTADGATTLLDADIAVACLGVVPRTRLATACGLNTQRGIVVNPQTLAAAPGVFALGDCIEINGELSSTIAPMTAQARCIASQISGKPENYAPVRSPWIVKTPCFPIHIQ